MRKRWKKRRVLEAELRALFAQDLEPAALRTRIEQLAEEPAFGALVHIWGPELYHRQRIMFRPFFSRHFSAWNLARWKGSDGERLDRWLRETEENDDRELFVPLYRRKIHLQNWGFGRARSRAWGQDLLQRLRQAGSAEERDRVLKRCEFPLQVDPETAMALYRLDPAAARDFLAAHFSARSITRWSGRAAPELDRWLQETEESNDVWFFQMLYRRKLELQTGGLVHWMAPRWCRDLRQRLSQAADSRQREAILARFNLRLPLDEDTAIGLYQLDAGATEVFILNNLPKHSDRLKELVRNSGNEDFYFRLYRQTTPRRQWLGDVFQLCDSMAEPARLMEALEQRQPFFADLFYGDVYRLLLRRGEDVLPYLRKQFPRIRSDWPFSKYRPLLELCQANGWLDLWAGLLGRHAWPWEYTRAITHLIEEADLPDEEIKKRLLLLCGLPHQDSKPLASPSSYLSDRLAETIYRRFPDLLRGPLRSRLLWGGVSSYPRLAAAARAAGDDELWNFLQYGRSDYRNYEADLRSLLNDPTLDDDTLTRRLKEMAGVSAEWNYRGLGVAEVWQLSDKMAVALYQRLPELVRGPFRKHVAAGYGLSYPLLTAAALEANDAELIDYLAGRLVTRPWLGWMVAGPMRRVVEKLASHYEDLLGRPQEFVVRAVSVLEQIPAYSIGNQGYNQLIRNNRLARLLFERSAVVYLDYPQLLRDLLEAPEIHVQALALHALGLNDPRVRSIAADNLDLLLPTLLRSLHRRTRRLAFSALLNAAVTSEDNARLILDRARQALDLPSQHYPREALIGLIGQLLRLWPRLRGPREQPRIFSEKTS